MRKAVAMIELIFAIVVIGFVLSTVPNLMTVASNSVYTSLQQEAINSALSQMSMIMEAQWDHADANYTNGSPILEVDSAILPLPPVTDPINTLPFGVTSQTGRRCVYDTTMTRGHAVPPSALGKENTYMENAGYFDDVDDYNNKVTTIVGATSSTGDYIDNNISMLTKVYYGDDQPKNADGSNSNFSKNTEFNNPFRQENTKSTNIKLVTIDLTSTNPFSELGDKRIRFSTFMCNIGAPHKILTNEP
jgi:type II secretory pathway pseudopilin PulG